MTVRGRVLAGLLACLGVLVGICAVPRQAQAIEYILGEANVGGLVPPFGTVNVVLTDPTHATVTFQALSSGGYNYYFIDGGAAAVEINATNFAVSTPSLTGVGAPFAAPTVVGWEFNRNNDGFGQFDARFSQFDGFQQPSSRIVFEITNIGGFWASDANVLEANEAGYRASAHMAACYVGNCSPDAGAIVTFFVADGGEPPPPPRIPEPATLSLLGAGLLALGLIVRGRKPQLV